MENIFRRMSGLAFKRSQPDPEAINLRDLPATQAEAIRAKTISSLIGRANSGDLEAFSTLASLANGGNQAARGYINAIERTST